ncbi:hypothetical protein TNCV_2533161 [Trichonephila clavipes]|nr:hypothetical protein TNCV_2533161 [Trichonephila clavipes]
MPLAEKWNVRKASTASFTFDRKLPWNGTTLCLLMNPAYTCNITMAGFEFRDTVLALHLCGSRGLAISHIPQHAIFFFTNQIPLPACSADLSPIENVWSMVAP